MTFMALSLRLMEQLRSIRRIHQDATNSDLHKRGSHQALSRFVLVAAIGLLVPM